MNNAEKLVKQYDLGTLIVNKTKDTDTPLRAHGNQGKLVILDGDGDGGILVIDDEGCHFILARPTDAVTVYCDKVSEDKDTISLVPVYQLRVSVDEIRKSPCTEVRLGDFVRRFGRRLEANYDILLGSIQGVGLNPENYPRTRKG